jgi:hypothetical protein
MIKTKNIQKIEDCDWDELVSNTYGRLYHIQQQDGCRGRGLIYITIPEEYSDEYMNDKIPEIINDERNMGVKFDVWLNRDPKAPLNPSDAELKTCNYYYDTSDRKSWCEDKSHIGLFWERNFYPNVQAVANDLHKKGLIEAGEYAIKIDW